MALDEGGGKPTPPKKKRKPTPVLGEQASGGSKVPVGRVPSAVSRVEENRVPYRGSSNPAFQRTGFTGDIFSFNRRAERANAAFHASFGFEPSPGLLFDLIRAPVTDDEYEDLLMIPRSFQRARAQAALRDEIETADYTTDVPGDTGVEQTQEATSAILGRQQAQEEATRQGLYPGTQTMGIGDDLGLPGLALIQVGESLVYAPAGAYEAGKALGFDVRDLARDRDPSFTRSRELGKQMGASIVETYRNPLENPGYIFMDALGLVSAGGGVVGRAAKFRKTGRKRDLIRRPEGGTFELGGEEVLLSENTSARVVQRALLENRKRRLEKRRKNIPDSYAPLTRKDKIRGFFSTEAKIGREARARQRVEHQIAMERKRELDAVAGWAINSSRAFSHMPNALRRGLTRGEQKAIQILATDEPGGWRAQVAVHRNFHEKMLREGVGDPQAHTRQLADIALAEKALEKPRKRFQEAAALTRDVIQEQELLKIERLGLNADAARNRVAAFSEVLRTGKPVEGVSPKLVEGSFYLPSTPRPKSRQPVSERVPTARPGRFGIPEPRQLPELNHVFTGESIRWGDTRIDATHLAGESYTRAVRLAALLDEHKRLLAQATDQKRSEWDILIRETAEIPDDLRAVVNQFDEGAVSKGDLDGLSPKFQETLYQHLFPETKVPGVRWVDSRLIGDAWRYPNEPGFGTKLATAINEPFRTTTLFLRPAYALNLLGNTAMLLVQSGGAPMNIAKAARANKRYGAKNVRTMEAVVSEGKALSFAPDDLIPTKVSRTLAHGWNALVDRKFRLAALIHEMERKGYKTKADADRLWDMKTTDEKIKKDRVEISRRGNKAVVEFNNLTPFEKNTLRHWIFVYPWVSRSVVWSLRTMVEHPLKTWSLVQLGKVGEEAVKDELGEELPEWFTNTGYFPIHTDDEGNPLVVNPTSINTFSSMHEATQQVRGLFTDQPYVAPQELLGPAAEFGIRFATGQDAFGTEYEEGALLGAAQEIFKGLPQVAAAKRKQKPDPDADPASRPSFIPGEWGDVYGPLIAGGFWPRTADTEALAAKWQRDQPKESRDAVKAAERAKEIKGRLAIERRAIMQAERYTAEFINGRALPEDVRDALDLQMRFAESYANIAIRHPKGKDDSVKETPMSIVAGRGLTSLEKGYVQIQTLHDMGRIDAETAQRLAKDITKAADKSPADLTKWRAEFGRDYLNSEALSDWHAERDEILEVSANVEGYMKTLRQKGLYTGSPGKLTQTDTLKVGQEFFRFKREARVRAEDTGERSDLVTLDNALDREWQDAQDKPISIDGKKYPSAVRLAWAQKPQEEQLADIAEWSTGSWDSLSDFEKELVGRKPTKGVSRGWVAFHAVTDGYRGNVTAEDAPDWLKDVIPDPLDERSVSKEHKLSIAKWVDKNIAPGFYKDYLYSAQPNYQRYRVLPIITKSKAASEWRELMQVADGQFAYIRAARDAYAAGRKPDYTITSVQQGWDDYAKNTLYPYFQENGSDTLKTELELLGGVDFLRSLISD